MTMGDLREVSPHLVSHAQDADLDEPPPPARSLYWVCPVIPMAPATALVAVVVQAAGQGQVVVRARAVTWEMGMVTVVRLPGAVRLS